MIEFNKKTLYLKKVNLSKNKSLQEELRNQFEDIDSYFDTSNKIIIGKKIHFPPLFDIPEKNSRIGMYKRTTRRKKTTTTTKTEREKIDEIHKDTYQVLDENSIKNLFETFKTKQRRNKLKINSNLKKLPKAIQINLRYQTNSLATKSQSDKHNRSLSNYLINKTNKKTPEELLINNIDKYRVKKELINSIDNSVPFDKKYGVYNWSVSLRRPKNFHGTRTSMINVGSTTNPFWSIVREKNPCTSEIVLKTDGNIKKKKNFDYFSTHYYTNSSSPSNSTLTVNNYYYNTVSNNSEREKRTLDLLDEKNPLTLCGKSLLNFEYDCAVNMKGRAIIKRNVNVTDGSSNNLLHEQYMKEATTGDEIFYENYDNKQINLGETLTSQTHLVY